MTPLFISLAVMLIVASVFSFQNIISLTKSYNWVNHTNVVKNKLVQVLSNLREAESSQRGFLLTYDTSYLAAYGSVGNQLNRLFISLDSLFVDNSEQQKKLIRLKAMSSERLFISQKTMELVHNRKPELFVKQSLENGKIKMAEVSNHIQNMINEEDKLLKSRTEVKDRQAKQTPALALLISLASVIIISIAFLKTRQESILRQVSNEALKIKNDDLMQQQDFVDAVFDASVDIMSVMDTNLRYTRFNKAGEKAYNKTRQELIGKSFVDLYPHIVKNGLHSDLKKALAGEIIHQPEYYSSETKNYYELFLIPLKTRLGQVDSILIIAHDITFIVSSKQELLHKNQQLELTNQELASFSYIASHDLKEPLRKIQVFSKRIMEIAKLSEKEQDYFKRITNASERMQNLIESLLHFSQVNNMQLNFESCNLNDILDNARSYIEETILDKEAIIHAEPLPTIQGFPVQLEQLFTNLLDNAIKYCKAGVQPIVTITSLIVNGNKINAPFANQHKIYYHLAFADNGIGFDQEFEHKIFEIFQRLHGKNEYAGTGIGLAICKKIVANHNGFITAQGSVGDGATFHVYLLKEDVENS